MKQMLDLDPVADQTLNVWSSNHKKNCPCAPSNTLTYSFSPQAPNFQIKCQCGQTLIIKQTFGSET